MDVAGIILAAGGSTRMGACKALLQHPDGYSMLEAHTRAFSSCCQRVIVVAGAHHQDIRDQLPSGCQLVENPDWETTDPYASLLLGLNQAASSSVLVTPVDTPPASPVELSKLLKESLSAVLSWKQQAGHPVLLKADVLDRIRSGERPIAGLGSLLTGARHVEADNASILTSWNTLEQWQSWHDSTSH